MCERKTEKNKKKRCRKPSMLFGTDSDIGVVVSI
jgi:hypothetical protein